MNIKIKYEGNLIDFEFNNIDIYISVMIMG